MADIEDRLRVVERVPVPDVWDRASARSADLPFRGSLPDPSPPRRQRIAAAFMAAVVAFAGIAFAVQAFDEDEGRIAEPSPAPATRLDGTSWVLTTIDDERVVNGTEDSWFTLQFRDGEFRADSGCNRISGTYEIDRGLLRTQVRDMSETVSACGSALSADDQRAVVNVLGEQAGATLYGATLKLDAAEHELGFDQDPCSLLTSEQVAAEVGSAVESVRLVPPSGMRLPGSGPVCSYEVPETPFSSVGVEIETSTLEEFESRAAEDEANFMDVSGVGDRAYISGMASIVVFDRSREIEIGLQLGAGDAAVPVLEALGRVATGGDEAGGQEPSPEDYAESLPDLVGNASMDQGAALAIDYGEESILIGNGESHAFLVPTGTRVLIGGTAETIAWGWGAGLDPYDRPVPVARQIPIVVHGNEGDELLLRLRASWTDGTTGEWTLRFTLKVPPRDDLVLACPPSERTPFDLRGPYVLPGSDLFIRANVEGVTERDAVAQVTWPEGPGSWNGTWVIYREGALVAFVNYKDLSGTACDGTGIGDV